MAKVGLERLGSPIERMFVDAIMREDSFQPRQTGAHEAEIGRWPGWSLALLSQMKIGRYCCDFLIMSTCPEDVECPKWFVVIEADGHNYHERTKEQARHDRARDRFFTTRHAHVLRYTGSELHADADECAYEAVMFAIRLQEANLNEKFAKYLEAEAAKETFH